MANADSTTNADTGSCNILPGSSLGCISQLIPAIHQLSELADAQLHATH